MNTNEMCEWCQVQESVIEILLPDNTEQGEHIEYICLDCAEN